MTYSKLLSVFLSFYLMSSDAFAQGVGKAVPWQIGMQDAASSSAEYLHSFHEMMIYIIAAISLFVFVLLVYVVLRYNKHVNPTPSKFSHNVLIEVLWTLVPVVILIVIALPSMRMLYFLERTENPDMTLKVTGYQWYWGYEYPDHEDINFLSYMIPDEEIDKEKGQERLLSTDNVVVLPTGQNIQILMTAADVLHSWAVPALGIKIDAVPGRINETWVHINKPGVYYGQCSELCGKDHSYMPIEIRAVPPEEFDLWVRRAKQEFSAIMPPTSTRYAALPHTVQGVQ